MILVVAEQKSGVLSSATWETVAAAQQLAAGGPISIVVAGSRIDAVAGHLAKASVEDVLTIDHPALEAYTPDGYTAALADAVTQLSPDVVLMAHTYQTRDLAPKLATRLDRALVTDVTGFKQAGGETAFTRPMFQGKM